MTERFATAKLGEDGMVSVILGQSPPSSTYNETRSGLPFFQGKADFGMVHPTPRIWCEAGEQFARTGDVLISVRAPVGDINMAPGDCAIGRGISAIRTGERIHNWFLFFALQFARPMLESRATGSTFASINKSTILDLAIPLPDLDEQRAIAAILRFVTSSIEHETIISEEVTDLKRAAMRNLFTLGLRGEPQKETEIGPVPETWDVVRLGSLGRVGNGSTPKKTVPAYWNSGTYPWLTSAKVYDREIVAADHFVTAQALDECHLPRIKPGSVLIAITGQGKTLGHCAVLRIEATINQHLAYVATDIKRADPSFIRGYLETQYDYLRQIGSGGGSTKGALTCAFLRQLQIPLPPTLREQQEIVVILDAIDRKIDVHRRKRAVLEELFKSLLHKLMTGEVRVSDLDLSALQTLAPAEASHERARH